MSNSEAVYLKSTIRSLEESLNLAKAGLAALEGKSPPASNAPADSPDTDLVKRILEKEGDANDFAERTRYERAVRSLSVEGQRIIMKYALFNRMLEMMTPEAAAEFRSLSERLPNVFNDSDRIPLRAI